MILRLLILVFTFLSFLSALPAATKQTKHVPSRSVVTRSVRPAVRAVPTKSTRTATVRKAPVKRYAASARYTGYRYAGYRYAGRNRRPMRAVVTHFRPVLAANNLEVMPEMVSPLGNLTARELQDSFFYRRPDGIIHYAIDIFREIGEPLYSVVDGTIERIDPNPLGGNVVYVVDEERRFRFYYAHLSRHADGIYAGMPVKRGDLIGYVGDTGNAKGTQPHLHFQIANLAGAVVNPFPLLMELVRREDTQLSE